MSVIIAPRAEPDDGDGGGSILGCENALLDEFRNAA
jgi:hypothetical protein